MPIYKGSSTINLESTTHSHTLSDITDAGTAAASNTGDFEASGAVSTHAVVTSGVHGISTYGATLVDDADAAAARTTLGLGTAATSATGDFLAASAASAFGLTLIDDADAATARTTLGLGTAATSATGDFEASGAVSTHAAITSGVHGISAFGATLVDDVDAATARTTLGLGTASTSNTGDFAATVHTHTLSQITDAGTAAALNVGTSANNVVQLDASGYLPAVDGSQLLNLPVSANTITSPLIDLDTLPDLSAGSVESIVALTQAQYDDIATPDPNIIYVITDGTAVTLSELVDDTTPQLGGNLDVNGNSIVSAAAGNILITPDTTGKIVLDGLSWPTADGTANQVLKTDGAGQLSFGNTTDFITTPTTSGVVRYFDDMHGISRQFYKYSGQQFRDNQRDTVANSSDASGILTIQTYNNYARFLFRGPQMYEWDAPDGSEWVSEIRCMIKTNASSNSTFAFGAHCQTSDYRSSLYEAGAAWGYSDLPRASVFWSTGASNWLSMIYDNEGTLGNSSSTDLGIAKAAQETWFTITTHCYKSSPGGVTTWTVDSYIDGTLVASQDLTSNTRAPEPNFCAHSRSNTGTFSDYFVIDWMSIQFTRASSVNITNIEDL